MISKRQLLGRIGANVPDIEDCKPNFKVPYGWRLVPVEPTCYQVLVGRNAKPTDDEPCVAAYLAMLAAAPEYKP